MGGDETTFPMDVGDEDPSSRPWNYRPEGYLVEIIADIQEGRRARAALMKAGFAPKDIKLYTGKQILDNQAVYIGRRSLLTKLLAPFVAEDVEGRDLYLAYAREDRCAMWVRILDGRIAEAFRVLADFDCLHARYYGRDEEHDFHIS